MVEVFAGRFELLEPIADGGMGSVWVVRDRRDGGEYAGKLLRHVDSSSLLRFMREQATRISHPHVVTPLSWAGEDDRVLFTMPLVRGGSLATLIGDHGALPAAWVGALLGQLLDALDAVHAAGVVHRDVKPANLLLRPTGTAAPYLLLSDFGIAARPSEPRLTVASAVVGSPGYQAPEQLRGADPDPAQDVYAVGVVGLEALTGVRPPRVWEAVGDVGPSDPGTVGLLRLLLAAAAEDPVRRPSVLEMRRGLAALDLGEPGAEVEVFEQVGAAPGPPPPPAYPPPSAPPATVVASSPTPQRPASARRAAVLFVMAAIAAIAAVVLLLR